MNGETGIDRGLRIPARDGFKLAATLFEPAGGWSTGDGGKDALVLISPATGAPRGYYEPFARFLSDRGFAVLAYDYRGMGDSRPKSLRGFRASMHEWGEEDLAGVIAWVVRHVQPSRLLGVGHSVGGQLVGLAENNQRFDALMTVASQSGWYGHWPESKRRSLAFRWHVGVPLISRIFGYVPGSLGIKEDLPGGVAREWAAWCRRPGFLLDGHPERRAGFERFGRPILAWSFEDDLFAPRPAVEWLLRLYGNAPVEHRHRPGEVGHFGFFRERFRDSLWKEAADWLAGHAEEELRRAA
ncbi:MAG TPA: alpha/beta fold hydrolase [Thermoanaerobaculia bacterium]|jgi:predicted alpha/beta hydrolase|nr:alpha/beta fold hydrolase [Thermoanaerobaculia bacterium]